MEKSLSVTGWQPAGCLQECMYSRPSRHLLATHGRSLRIGGTVGGGGLSQSRVL